MNKIYLLLVLSCFSLLFLQNVNTESQTINSFCATTSRLTFFELDDKGIPKLDNEGVPYQGKTETFTNNVDFSSQNAAFFVIDPWNDMPSDFLNDY